ncbi:unnamed protein product [Owenia fusiformis]|uniref:NAD-dependent protein deacylase n=1 Tax=Owenia fusiformis TaxID=6347 RepID=A0A8J1TU13_OWEFU|nr:unnamed protein product [Owenia fusiformis]
MASSAKRPRRHVRPSSNMAKFREHFAKAKHIVLLTGAGVSAESGVPTFRGAGGLWRKYQATDLATPEAFAANPSLLWEFYHYRRNSMLDKRPNDAHKAIAECEARLEKQERRVVIITQNIDELHAKAGSKNIIELHGNLFKVRCTKCGRIDYTRSRVLCPALEGKGEPDPKAKDARIPVEDLPKCSDPDCRGLIRPHVVWFGEDLDEDIFKRAEEELEQCDLCLLVGTSSVVYPAAMFAPNVAARGVPVAEFNMEDTKVSGHFGFHFSGPAGVTIPIALAEHKNEIIAQVESEPLSNAQLPDSEESVSNHSNDTSVSGSTIDSTGFDFPRGKEESESTRTKMESDSTQVKTESGSPHVKLESDTSHVKTESDDRIKESEITQVKMESDSHIKTESPYDKTQSDISDGKTNSNSPNLAESDSTNDQSEKNTPNEPYKIGTGENDLTATEIVDHPSGQTYEPENEVSNPKGIDTHGEIVNDSTEPPVSDTNQQ